jgi:hypothetical protein
MTDKKEWPLCPKCNQEMIVRDDGGAHCYEHGPFRNGDEKQEAVPLQVHVKEAMGAKTKMR